MAQSSWQVLLCSRLRFYGQQFYLSDSSLTMKLCNPQVAIIEQHSEYVILLGTRKLGKLMENQKGDFHSFVLKQPEATWAFQNLIILDNGKDIANAIHSGQCFAVADGSYKDTFGMVAWILMTHKVRLEGVAMAPGNVEEQGSFHSELTGIYSIVHMVQHICTYYSITTGGIQISCDGLSALQQCFNQNLRFSPNSSHYDLILAIHNSLAHSPIHWHWTHILGHQDEVKTKTKLSTLKVLNIQMDAKAKLWWQQLSQVKHHLFLLPFQVKGGPFGVTNASWLPFHANFLASIHNIPILANIGNSPTNLGPYT